MADNIWLRVGLEPEHRLRWLLDFGRLEPGSLTDAQRLAVVQEARAFVIVQEMDPTRRSRMRSWPPPTDAAPNALTPDETWSAQKWLRKGLDLLSQSQKWNFSPRVEYELDAYRDLFWARMKATSGLQLFKALAYDAFREARFKFRRCPECKQPFVPIRRQRYCSPHCSQAVRTRKWRKAHPEKNRAIRRLQYRRAVTAKSTRK